MMKNVEQFYEECIEKWRGNGGNGTMLLAEETNPFPIVLGILQRIYARSPTSITIIVVNEFFERTNLIQYLTSTEDEENNNEFKNLINNKIIKIFTSKFMENYKCPNVNLGIIIGDKTVNEYSMRIFKYSRFKLTITSKLIQDSNVRSNLYILCPKLDGFDQNEIAQLRLSTPVEEIQVGVDFDNDNDKEELEKCNQYITQSLNIFGNFDIMNKCRTGDTLTNTSSEEYCNRIANENGWSYNLDMSNPFNVQIDEMYNPGSLRNRAHLTYEVVRRRSNILTDSDDKLRELVHIVETEQLGQTLIISKRGEYAAKITETLNQLSGHIICGDYHEKMDNIPAIDHDGKPVFYKTGAKKGQRKYMAAKAQRTFNEEEFISKNIQFLSCSNSPSKELSVTVDTIIITSPLCDTLEEYIYRLSNLRFGNGIKLYSLFLKDTMEQKRIIERETPETHNIVNNCEIDTDFDKNLGIKLRIK